MAILGDMNAGQLGGRRVSVFPRLAVLRYRSEILDVPRFCLPRHVASPSLAEA